MAEQIVDLIAHSRNLLKTLQEFCISQNMKIHHLTDFKKTLTLQHFV